MLLTEQGLQESRQKAQATIMSGLVFVNGQRVDKPGTAVPNDAKIEIRGNTLKYVSRGGLKLEKAMAEFPIELNGCICGDIGASTGGFTDCMLQNGASKVYSVDVGYGQLAWKLRAVTIIIYGSYIIFIGMWLKAPIEICFTIEIVYYSLLLITSYIYLKKAKWQNKKI